MPTAWQPDSISQITSQSWKKHQKLGQDHRSLCSVLDNEVEALLPEGSLRKGSGEESGSEWVMARDITRPVQDSMMARNTAYTISGSTSSCTESAFSAKQRREEAGLGGAQELMDKFQG